MTDPEAFLNIYPHVSRAKIAVSFEGRDFAKGVQFENHVGVIEGGLKFTGTDEMSVMLFADMLKTIGASLHKLASTGGLRES